METGQTVPISFAYLIVSISINHVLLPGIGSNAFFNMPVALDISKAGEFLYVSDSGANRIRRIAIANAKVSTIAGSGLQVDPTFADGIGTFANFNSPTGIALDPTNMILYVSDMYFNRIRQIDLTTNAVSTIAGNGRPTFANGVGTAASFSQPRGCAVHPSGAFLFVSDAGSSEAFMLGMVCVSS